MYKGPKNDFGQDQLSQQEARKQLPHIKTPDPVDDNMENSHLEGVRIYNRYCATCHQRNGKGDGSRFPPLVGSEWVNGDKSRLIEVG